MNITKRVIEQTREKLKEAGFRFFRNSDHFNDVIIKTDLKGIRTLGQTRSRWNKKTEEMDYILRFNLLYAETDFESFKNTISHEVAHMVCFFDADFGNSHDKGWRRVHKLLGGNGLARSRNYLSEEKQEKHQIKRNQKSFEYIATCGSKVVLSTIRHNRIQKKGEIYTFTETRGKLHSGCEWKEIYK